MNNFLAKIAPLAALTLLLALASQAQLKIPADSAIDAQAKQIMARMQSNGLAIGVIDYGKVSYVQAYGIRNAKGEPLTTDTVMYGASLTKIVFAYHVMQLVDQGKLKLDTPIKDDLDIPLTEYGDHSDKKFLGNRGV